MVIIKPMTKVINIISNNFLVLVMVVPTLSPIIVIESSTPIEKSSNPTVRSTAPIKNAIKILGEIGAILKHSNITIANIGNTAFKISTDFSLIIVLLICNPIKRLSSIDLSPTYPHKYNFIQLYLKLSYKYSQVIILF